MNAQTLIGRQAMLVRDVPLIGGDAAAGTRIVIESAAGPEHFNVRLLIGGPRHICRLPREAFAMRWTRRATNGRDSDRA